MKHADDDVLVRREPPQGGGIESGGRQRVVRGARPGVGDQDDVTRIVAAPVDRPDRLVDAGVGILVEALARHGGRLDLVDAGQECVAAAAILQVGEGAADVAEGGYRGGAVAVRDEAVADALGKLRLVDGPVNALHDVTRRVDVGLHRHGRIDHENDAGTIGLDDRGGVLQRYRRYPQQSRLLAADEHVFVVEDRHEVEIATDVDVLLRLHGHHRRIGVYAFYRLLPQAPVGCRIAFGDDIFQRVAVAEQQYPLVLGRVAKRDRECLLPIDGFLAGQPALDVARAVEAHLQPGPPVLLLPVVDVVRRERRHDLPVGCVAGCVHERSAGNGDDALVQRTLAFLQQRTLYLRVGSRHEHHSEAGKQNDSGSGRYSLVHHVHSHCSSSRSASALPAAAASSAHARSSSSRAAARSSPASSAARYHL